MFDNRDNCEKHYILLTIPRQKVNICKILNYFCLILVLFDVQYKTELLVKYIFYFDNLNRTCSHWEQQRSC